MMPTHSKVPWDDRMTEATLLYPLKSSVTRITSTNVRTYVAPDTNTQRWVKIAAAGRSISTLHEKVTRLTQSSSLIVIKLQRHAQ